MATIWNSQTFTKPTEGWPASGVVASSSIITKANNSTGVNISLEYNTISPDGNTVQVGFTLRTVIEEEVATGIFIPIATQFDAINNNTTKGKQILILTPDPIFDQGVPEGLSAGGGSGVTTQINRTQGSLPPKYRICVIRSLNDPTKPDLDSITLSAFSRET